MSRDDEDRPATPSYIASYAQEGKDGKSYFKEIGAAFPHKDGKGHNIDLGAVPLKGPIILREPQERLEEKRNGDDRRDSRDRRSSRDRDDR